MKVFPLFDRVVLTQIKDEPTKTASGLVLPDTAQERPLTAEVIAVGNGITPNGESVEMQVNVGDIVLYSKYAGSVFKMQNKEVVIIKQSDILAIIEK